MKVPAGLLDNGPLVSFLAAGLEHHAWAVEQWKELRPPLLTCEPVLTEAAFLLKRQGRDTDALFALLQRGVVRIAISVERGQAVMSHDNADYSLSNAASTSSAAASSPGSNRSTRVSFLPGASIRTDPAIPRPDIGRVCWREREYQQRQRWFSTRYDTPFPETARRPLRDSKGVYFQRLDDKDLIPELPT